MSEEIPFTTRKIQSLMARSEKYEVREVGRTGLRLRVSTTGIKSFRWPCTAAGRVFTLGTFGDGTGGTITLAQARAKLEELRTKVAAGTAVEAGERPRTVAQLADLFYRDSLAKRRKRPEAARWVLDKHIVAVIGTVPLVAVDTMLCRKPITHLLDRGRARSAAVALAVEKQLFGFAAKNGLLPHNPARELAPADFGIVASERKRWLAAEEIVALLAALDAAPLDDVVRRGLKVLLYTGLRSAELMTLQWRDVDFEAATLTVRIENMKLTKVQAANAEPLVQPLSTSALALMRELRALTPKTCPWVLASPRTRAAAATIGSEPEPPAPLSEKALVRAMARMWSPERKRGQKMPEALMRGEPARPHDFRRTIASHLSDTLGFAPHVGQLVLGHSLNQLLGSGVATTYDRAKRVEERRQALQAYADWIGELANKKAASVVPLRSGTED